MEQDRSPPADPPSGSGAQTLVGYRIDLSDPEGRAVVRLRVAAQHLNRNRTLQGGIHAMLLDAAAGFAASRHFGGQGDILPVVTLSLNVQYLAPTAQGEVTAVGHVTGGGHKIVHAEAEISGAEGCVLSRGSGVFKRVAR